MKGKIVQYLFCIALLFVTSSVALGRSVDDGNNTATTAEAVSLQTTVSDVVGPDDQFDYYLLKVADGDSITGSIKFESKVVGTVLRITGPDGTIFEKSTTDESLSFEYTIPNKLNKPGHTTPV